MVRRLLSIMSIPLLAIMLSMIAPAPTAHADTIDAVCVDGSHTIKWSPPLTFVTQDVSFAADGGFGDEFSGICTFTADSSLHTVTFHMGGEATASCTAGSGTGNIRFNWDDGSSSFVSPLTVTFAPNPNGTGLAIDATGTVRTDGNYRFAGDTVHASFTQAADPTLCATTGIDEASGPCPQVTFIDETDGPAVPAARRS